MNQRFNDWLSRHPCDTEKLWRMQNMLGSCLGWNHPLYREAQKAWEESRGKLTACRGNLEWKQPTSEGLQVGIDMGRGDKSVAYYHRNCECGNDWLSSHAFSECPACGRKRIETDVAKELTEGEWSDVEKAEAMAKVPMPTNGWVDQDGNPLAGKYADASPEIKNSLRRMREEDVYCQHCNVDHKPGTRCFYNKQETMDRIQAALWEWPERDFYTKAEIDSRMEEIRDLAAIIYTFAKVKRRGAHSLAHWIDRFRGYL